MEESDGESLGRKYPSQRRPQRGKYPPNPPITPRVKHRSHRRCSGDTAGVDATTSRACHTTSAGGGRVGRGEVESPRPSYGKTNRGGIHRWSIRDAVTCTRSGALQGKRRPHHKHTPSGSNQTLWRGADHCPGGLELQSQRSSRTAGGPGGEGDPAGGCGGDCVTGEATAVAPSWTASRGDVSGETERDRGGETERDGVTAAINVAFWSQSDSVTGAPGASRSCAEPTTGGDPHVPTTGGDPERSGRGELCTCQVPSSQWTHEGSSGDEATPEATEAGAWGRISLSDECQTRSSTSDAAPGQTHTLAERAAHPSAKGGSSHQAAKRCCPAGGVAGTASSPQSRVARGLSGG